MVATRVVAANAAGTSADGALVVLPRTAFAAPNVWLFTAACRENVNANNYPRTGNRGCRLTPGIGSPATRWVQGFSYVPLFQALLQPTPSRSMKGPGSSLAVSCSSWSWRRRSWSLCQPGSRPVTAGVHELVTGYGVTAGSNTVPPRVVGVTAGQGGELCRTITPMIKFEFELRYWNAVNYLTVAQIYLQADPLLREALSGDHIKPRLFGHWGTSPVCRITCTCANISRTCPKSGTGSGPVDVGPCL